MAFGLERTSVVFDDNDFEAFREVNSSKYYFAERIDIKGKLNFGEVAKEQEVRISLADNNITTPITMEALFAFTSKGTSDEIYLNIYTEVGDNITRIGRQRISAGQMPYNIPSGILMPNMTIGVEPTKSDSTIIAYAKPVAVSFEAVPNPGITRVDINDVVEPSGESPF